MRCLMSQRSLGNRTKLSPRCSSARLAPFHSEQGDLGSHRLRVNDRRNLEEVADANFPFSDVARLRDWPEQVVAPTTDLGAVHQLLLTAEVGRLPSGFAEGITASGRSRVAP